MRYIHFGFVLVIDYRNFCDEIFTLQIYVSMSILCVILTLIVSLSTLVKCKYLGKKYSSRRVKIRYKIHAEKYYNIYLKSKIKNNALMNIVTLI